MPLFVRSQVRLVRFNLLRVERLVSAILFAVGESPSELSVTFVGDRRMRRLNCRYRRKDRTTDVLAFAARDARMPHTLHLAPESLGDVVIAAPTAARQARKGNRSFDEEVAALLVHGILHLCGYDHERSQTEARRMNRREKMILKQLGKIPHLIGTVRRQ
jgi:rRNA maturation RNase YbeY